MELAEHRFALGVDEAERVHAEALHHPQATRDRPIGHDPHQHVRRLGHQRDEIPEGIVRGRRLRHAMMRFRFHGMDQVGKLHCVLDKEDRDVVAYQVPVAFVGIELDCESANVARGIDRSAFAGDCGKANKHRRALAGLCEYRCTSDSVSGHSPRSSHGPLTPVHGQCAPECAHDRSG